MKYIFSVAIIIFMTGLTGPASAEGTPDGITPANEAVCDTLIGGTPGLYGLCVAYCEAQDLDQFDKNPPSRRLLENYRKKMRSGDSDMPCVQPPSSGGCPCWTVDELLSISGSRGTVACRLFSDYSRIYEDDGIATQLADSGMSEAGLICRYIDETLEPDVVRYMEPTPEEDSICRAQINRRCEELGLANP
jgi:hypothetical protein